MRRRRRLTSVVAGIAAGVLLLLAVPRHAGREPQLVPRWTASVADATPTPAPAAALATDRGVPFRLRGSVGYVSAAGQVLFREPVLYGATVGAAHFINYSRVSANLAVRDQWGGLVAGVVTDGYPVLSPDGEWFVAVADTGLDLSAHRSIDGHPLWRASISAPATCISMSSDHLLLGTADGGLLLLDREGDRRDRLQLSGGAIDVVVGCTTDGRGRGAAMAGLRPQQLFVLDTVPELRIARRFDLASDHRSEVPLSLLPGADVLATASTAGTLVMDLASGRQCELAVASPTQFATLRHDVTGQRAGAGGALFGVAGGGETPMLVIGFASGSQRRLLVSIPAAVEWLAAADGGLLVGIDGVLLRVDIQNR